MYRQHHGQRQMRIWSSYLGPRARLNSRRSYLTARGPRLQAWFSLHKSRRRRQPSVRSSPNCFPPVWNGSGRCSQVPATQCTGEDPSMYASMTAVTRLPHCSRRRPGSANQTACEWLTWYSIKALHRFTSPHTCRCRDSLSKMIRFDSVVRTMDVEPPTQSRRPGHVNVPSESAPCIVTSPPLHR
jgi:hypothetical protein